MKQILLFLVFLFSGCTPTENVSELREIGQSEWASINELTIDSHDYLLYDRGISHSGTCRKCKQERDSIVNLIINTIENGRNSKKDIIKELQDAIIKLEADEIINVGEL